MPRMAAMSSCGSSSPAMVSTCLRLSSVGAWAFLAMIRSPGHFREAVSSATYGDDGVAVTAEGVDLHAEGGVRLGAHARAQLVEGHDGARSAAQPVQDAFLAGRQGGAVEGMDVAHSGGRLPVAMRVTPRAPGRGGTRHGTGDAKSGPCRRRPSREPSTAR